MTLQNFAQRFSVSHPAVLKWEKTASKPTAMTWATEKDLRLHILAKLEAKPSALVALYSDLEREASKSAAPVEIDAAKLAA